MLNLGFKAGLHSLASVFQKSSGKCFYCGDWHLIFVLSALKLVFVSVSVPFVFGLLMYDCKELPFIMIFKIVA